MRPSGLATLILLTCCLPNVLTAGFKPIDASVQIRQGSPLRIPFSVPKKGVYVIELCYRAADTGHFNVLEEIAGSATVTSDGRVIRKVELPTHWLRSGSGFFGVGLTRFRSDSARSYILALEIRHVPSRLKDAEAVVRVTRSGHWKYAAQRRQVQ